MFKRIAIFGLGFIGGSLCRSVKEIYPGVELFAYGRDINRLKPAVDDGIIDYADTIEKASLRGIDLIIVSTPVIVSIDIIKNILENPELEKEAIIIDVGSVKGAISREIEKCEKAAQFIGCHPLAGSEKMGYNYSISNLFEGSSVIITPGMFNKDEDIERIKNFWEELKSKVCIVPAEVHDLVVSFTSHLPHLVSSSVVKVLMDYLSDEPLDEDINTFISNGFRDVTRVSSGSPEMWCDIIELNRENILSSISNMIDVLKSLQGIIEKEHSGSGKSYNFFLDVKNFRDSIK